MSDIATSATEERPSRSQTTGWEEWRLEQRALAFEAAIVAA